MDNSRSKNQEPRNDDDPKHAASDSDLIEVDSEPADLRQHLTGPTRDLEQAEATIAALSAELTARENQISSILNTRAWRWVNRYSRIKRGYVVPAYEFLRSLYDRDGKTAVSTAGSGNLETSATSSGVQAFARPLTASDVICFSNMDWDFRYQRPQQIMTQFSEHGNRVFYIRLDRILSASSTSRFSLTKLKENLFEVTLAAEREVWINQEEIKGANADALLASLGELRTAHGIDEAIGYVMTPAWTSVALAAKSRWGWRLIYDCMDEWEGFPGIGRAIPRAEQRLVRECDLLVVTAQRLYDKWRPHSRRMTLNGNAVDYQFYAERCQPNAILKGITHPVIGYFGAIAEWFDVELMVYVARARPNYTFVFLGRIVGADISELERLPNVRLLGQQPYETMPQYLYHFDACLIPFKLNQTTKATDPVKVYEYLAGGKPIVSVDLPELEPFKDLIYIANDRDHFVEQLDQALAESAPKLIERRRRFAAANTWKDRYVTIVEGIGSASRS